MFTTTIILLQINHIGWKFQQVQDSARDPLEQLRTPKIQL